MKLFRKIKITSYQIGTEIHTITLDLNKRKFYHYYYDKHNPVNFGVGEVKDFQKEVGFYLDMFTTIEDVLDEKLALKG